VQFPASHGIVGVDQVPYLLLTELEPKEEHGPEIGNRNGAVGKVCLVLSQELP
jgi:hypothetical protein